MSLDYLHGAVWDGLQRAAKEISSALPRDARSASTATAQVFLRQTGKQRAVAYYQGKTSLPIRLHWFLNVIISAYGPEQALRTDMLGVSFASMVRELFGLFVRDRVFVFGSLDDGIAFKTNIQFKTILRTLHSAFDAAESSPLRDNRFA